MIDPVSAFAAISAGHAAIMKGIQIGKDISSLGGAISKYAEGEAQLQLGESRKKRSKFSIAEDSAIEKHFKKEKLADMRKELRSMFQLYGKPGQWERLQAEIANERAQQQRMLKEKARIYDRNVAIAISVVIICFGAIAIYFWAMWLKGQL